MPKQKLLNEWLWKREYTASGMLFMWLYFSLTLITQLFKVPELAIFIPPIFLFIFMIKVGYGKDNNKYY